MLSCEEYHKESERCISELKELHKQMERAGIANKGDYLNQIENKETDVKFYQRKYQECFNAKEPDQVGIYLYVLVSTKEKVQAFVGDELFKLFETDRYHEASQSEWRPYQGQPNIIELLQNVRVMYNFQPIFLDGEINEDCWVQIDDFIHDSVAIIDLFSLSGDNNTIAQKFDTNKAGVLLPVCTSLDRRLKEKADQCQGCFKVLHARTKKIISCDFFSSDISTNNSFQQDIIRIFKHKFPIKNKSSYQSDVRGLNITFS